MISIIAAIDKNRALGYQNKLLVHLPEDLAYFKKITSGHPVIMGQNTYVSIGRALPNRVNIVLSKNKDFQAQDCVVFDDLNKALEFAKSKNDNEIFFIGGASVYEQAIKLVDKIYLTIIDQEYQADVWFPDYSNFKIIKETKYQDSNMSAAGGHNPTVKYKFLELI